MKLYERFADKNYHTSIATTFGIDFDAYESIALSRLRGAGCRNNLVVSDSRMLAHALGGASELPQRAGTSYTVSGASDLGVFHPKIFLQLGRKGGRLIIGSANLTPSGLAGNLELVGSLTCDATDTGERQLIAQAWSYVSKFIDWEQQSVSEQVTWMRSRTGWLQSAASASGLVQLNDGTRAALLLSGEPSGIAQRFTDFINEPVIRLIVISPYWDSELAALSFLTSRLRPKSVAVLVDPLTRQFPKSAAERIENMTLYSRGTFREGRFIHAKAIIAQTATADHLLFGSANCTNAALGGASFPGINAEACLYRELPAAIVFDALKLNQIISDDRVILPQELNEPDINEKIPFAEIARKIPGTFEGRADVLIWHTKSSENAQNCKLALLGSLGQPIDYELVELAKEGEGSIRYQVKCTEKRPLFVRVTFADGSQSAPTIITWIDVLKLEVREPRHSGTQSRLDDLESDTEASLALLDIMNELETLEQDQSTPKAPVSIPKARSDQDAKSANHRIMSYEEFIAGRRPRTTGHELSYNSLAGSDISIVRGILNRIIGINSEDEHQTDKGQGEDDGAFDLADETDDAEGAMDFGSEFGSHSSQQDNSDADRQARRTQRQRATQEQLINAVQKFQAIIKERQIANEPLRNNDLVRLRALIMILATAGSPNANKSEAAKENRSKVRVLTVEGDQNSWPMLMGRLLFTFFGGKNPAIRLLHLTNEHDQIPGDFSECWATCYWAFQACMNAPLSAQEKTRMTSLLKPVAQASFVLTLPSKNELLADDVVGIMNRMNESYAAPLGIDPSRVLSRHREMVAETFGAQAV